MNRPLSALGEKARFKLWEAIDALANAERPYDDGPARLHQREVAADLFAEKRNAVEEALIDFTTVIAADAVNIFPHNREIQHGHRADQQRLRQQVAARLMAPTPALEVVK